MENRENDEGICIMSFDGGGPGSMSQLRILEEFMARLACEKNVEVDEVYPADYFDLMGGVGIGGLVALLLGRLRMTVNKAMEELDKIGTKTFPEGGDMVTPDVSMSGLRIALEDMLERNGHSVETKLRGDADSRCKVVIFAATTAVMDHCHPFRTYRSPRKCLECTLVDAACATMAIPEYFPPITVGSRRQSFAGIPHNLDNPIREVLKEAKLVFGENTPVSLVLSLGAGQRARHSSLNHATRRGRIQYDRVARDLEDQLKGVGEYLRLNVDRGMENIQVDDWHDLGSIETYTDVYLEMKRITDYIDRATQWLLQRDGSVTLGQLCGANTEHGVKFHSESLEKYLAMEFKQMHDVIRYSGIAKITLVDAIGNDIPIPIQFCVTYGMLLDVISVYFRHQNVPGSDFVERGDYRLVHGDRRNVLGAIEWTGIDKVGLKVEMSMILRTRNEGKESCPSCSAMFDGHSIDGWAQCLSCSKYFQIETQVQSIDTRSEDNSTIEPEVGTLVVGEPESSDAIMTARTINGEAGSIQFRLISVINLLEVNASAYPERYKRLILAILRLSGGLPGVRVPLSAVRNEIGEGAHPKVKPARRSPTFEHLIGGACRENYTSQGGIGGNKWIVLNAQNNQSSPPPAQAPSLLPPRFTHSSEGYAPRATSFNPSAFSTRNVVGSSGEPTPRATSFNPSALKPREVTGFSAVTTRYTTASQAPRRPSSRAPVQRLTQAYVDYDYDLFSPFIAPYDELIHAASGEVSPASHPVVKGNMGPRDDLPPLATGNPKKKKLDVNSLFRKAQKPTPAPIPTVPIHASQTQRPQPANHSGPRYFQDGTDIRLSQKHQENDPSPYHPGHIHLPQPGNVGHRPHPLLPPIINRASKAHPGMPGPPHMDHLSIPPLPLPLPLPNPATPSQSSLLAMPPNPMYASGGLMPHQMDWGCHYPNPYLSPHVGWQGHALPPHMGHFPYNPQHPPAIMQPPNLPPPNQTPIAMAGTSRIPPVAPEKPRPGVPPRAPLRRRPRINMFQHLAVGDLEDLSKKHPPKQEDASAVRSLSTSGACGPNAT